MRRGAAIAAAVCVVLVAASASAAGGGVRTIASFCSPSGDLCYGVVDRGGGVRLELTTAARYFGRYGLCVDPPPGASAASARRCGTFPVFRAGGGTWASSVRLRRQFPVGQPGVYRVTWRLGTQPLGPALRFRLPLR
ncbi:MAG: hypothetical protein ACM33B_00655 [Pseudomonadota bacterium]